MPYMSVAAIDAAVNHITSTFPAIAQAIALPEASVEGRPIKALKIAHGGGAPRTGVLFLGGTHARELINPETLVGLALRLCAAYTGNTGLAFGPKSYTASDVQLVVNGLDIFMLPMVNPDGRNFCLTAGGNPMWRKNRANHAGLACRGVDINRNADFLWSSGIGTSSDSCSDVFKGPGAFSEPETRNVRWMIDTLTSVACMIDVHSYSELVLYPWGDDENQTTDPNQNFRNPAFDGQRGIVGSGYKEFIRAADLHAHETTAARIRDGIKTVRNRVYTAEQSISLYPTSGTFHDYAYARNFIDTGRRRILGFTVETAREFQPADAEKNNVITEVSVGLMECLFETLCPAEAVQALLAALFPLGAIRTFRDSVMLTTDAGRRYEAMFRRHSLELVRLVSTDKAALKAAATFINVFGRLVGAEVGTSLRKIADVDLTEAAAALAVFQKLGSRTLQADMAATRKDLTGLKGLTLQGGFKKLGGVAPTSRGAKKAVAKKAPATKAAAKKAVTKKPAAKKAVPATAAAPKRKT
jgi:murein tripeptide amidase MpaA